MKPTTDIHTVVRELTTWHTHTQLYEHEDNGTTIHVTKAPPLIDQLNNADKAAGDNLSRTTPASRPAAPLEALDTLAHIDHQAATWVRKLGHDDPGTTIGCITKLHGLAAGATYCGRTVPVVEDRQCVCCDAHRIERDMRRWWTQARIVSGWDQAAWAPNNTCPHCDERRSLRIHVDDRTAFCTSCRETWDAGTIGVLAEHVRWENDDEVVAS